MESKSRITSLHPRRPLPGRNIVHLDPFPPTLHPPFHPFDISPPPPEVMEQKLASQHVEIERLAKENQRLASTHVTLRHELASAQHELQMLQAQIGAAKSEREQQMGVLKEKIGKMEGELQASDSIQLQLQQARKDAQGLVGARQELIVKAQQMSQDLQRVRVDAQQIPGLMSELENLRQEYQHCRATYDYEKKLYNDHLESLQVMDKNYVTMAREVEKLRAELTNSATQERRSGGGYGNPGYNEPDASELHPSAQKSYEEAYTVPQGQQGRGPMTYGATTQQMGPIPTRPAYYDAHKGPSFGSMYDLQRGAGYDPSRGYYDPQHGHGGGPVQVAAHGGYVTPATPPGHGGGGYGTNPNPLQR